MITCVYLAKTTTYNLFNITKKRYIIHISRLEYKINLNCC